VHCVGLPSQVFNPAELKLMGNVGTAGDASRSHLTEDGELVRLGENQGRLQPLSAEIVLKELPRATGTGAFLLSPWSCRLQTRELRDRPPCGLVSFVLRQSSS
jgi:hypothetical protein